MKVPVAPMKKTTKATISKLVANVLNRKSETKMVSYLTHSNTVFNSGIDFGDVYRLLPQVANGDQPWQRLGDTIRPLSLKVRGVISSNRRYQSDNRVLLVRVMMLSMKAVKCWGDISAANFQSSRLLRKNDESGAETVAYTGSPSDPCYRINEELFTVHSDKTYELSPGKGSLDPVDTSREQQPASTFRFSKTIKLPKVLKYDDSKGNHPANFAPFICIGYSYADGTGPDVVDTRIIANVSTTLSYKDF